VYHFYSMHSVQALQKDRTQNQHPLEILTKELSLTRATEKALRLAYAIHFLFHNFIFNTFLTEKKREHQTAR